VRHFKAEDVPYAPPGLIERLNRHPRALERVGRAAGWYVIARGRRGS
jgi:hypothetical protein